VWASIAAPAFAQQAVRPIANVAPALTPERLRVTGGGSVSASLTIGVPQILPPDAKRRWAVVRRIVIESNFAELQKQTVALVAHAQGRRLNLVEASEFAASVQQAYADAGYPLVNAVLQPRAFARGEIRIKIIDGFIEDLDLSGVPQELRTVVRNRLSALIGLRHVRLADLQRHILLIGELPGVTGSTQTRLGVEPGGVILVVSATLTSFNYFAGVHDYLPSNYGTYLFSQGFTLNNTLGYGETIHAEASSTDDFGQFFDGRAKSQAFGFGGSVPVGPDGFTLGASYSQSRVSPTPAPGEFSPTAPASEGVHGTLQRASLRANYPVFLSVQQAIRAQLGFDFTDNVGYLSPAPNFVTPAGDSIFDIYHDRYEDIRLAGEWDVNFPWAFGGKAVSALVYTHGLGGIAGDAFVPLSQPGASPDFNKLAGETHISQPLPDNLVFAGLARAQTGFGKPLMSAEQLQLAGPDVLSGFGLGTVYVDRGGVARGELQRPTALPFQGGAAVASPYVFGAYGGGRFDSDLPGLNPAVHALSYGFGVRTNASIIGWPFSETLNLEVARVTSNLPFAREGFVGSFLYQMNDTTNPFVAPPDRLERVSDRIPPNFGASGFYAGLNAGYALDGSPKVSSTGGVVSSAADARFFGNGAPVSAANITGSAAAFGNSPIGGAQAGYNLTNDVWLLGTEADIQGAGQSTLSSSSRMANATVAGVTETATTVFDDRKSLDWLGTVRGRIGMMAMPQLLAYVTGGLAYGGVSADTRATQSWNDPALGPFAATASSSTAIGDYSGTRVGWTAGAGLEWMFAPGFSLKGEYLYYNLGSATFTSGTLTTDALGFTNVVTSNSSAHFDGHIVRVGLNYHFGAEPEHNLPITKDPVDDGPVWTGLYAGLNSGYSSGLNSHASNGAAIGSTVLDQQLSTEGFTTSLAPAAAAAIPGRASSVPNGFAGGAQVGYNLQLNRGLVGVEADIDGTGARGHDSYRENDVFSNGTAASTFSLTTRVDNSMAVDWLGTLRGRLGLFLHPDILAYATGGLAYGETSSSTFVDQQWAGAILVAPKTSGSVGIVNRLMVGWTGGGGLEWMFAHNMSVKAEYLLYDLGVATYDSSSSITSIFGKSNSAIPITSAHYMGGTARAGFNYYFDP
jgi:hemolysin activation/secretion protein/opacity protein-like surface antigen